MGDAPADPTRDRHGGRDFAGLERRTGVALRRLEEITRAGAAPADGPPAEEAFEELGTALEELQAAGEELRASNDELLAAQRALREGRRAYQELFDFAPDGFLLTDGYGRVTMANLSACGRLGVPLSTLQGKPLTVFVEGDRAGFFHTLERLRRAGGRVEWNGSVRPRGGEPFPAAMSAVERPAGLPGERREFLWVLHDLSERQRFEQALRAREQAFRTLAENSPDLIARLDGERRLTYVNGAVAGALGRSPDHLVGTRAWMPGATPDDEARFERACRAALAGEEQRVETSALAPGGRRLWYEARIVPEPGEGEPTSLLVLCRDMTERRAAEDALRQSDELKSAMLGRVSHELRTPLTAIASAAEALRGLPLDPATQELAGLIEGEAARLGRMVTNLLDLSRLEGGALSARLEPYPLETLVASAVAGAQAVLGDASLDIDLGEGDEDEAIVLVDPVMTERILVNLLHNAATHGGPPVRVSARRENGDVDVSIEDGGPGIPVWDAEAVFLPFVGGVAAGGAGIGLALARAFAEAQGAGLSVEPGGDGRGACFTLRLRAAVPAPEERDLARGPV